MHNISNYIIEKLKLNKDIKPEKNYLKISDDKAMKIVSNVCNSDDDLAKLLDKYFEDWFFSSDSIDKNSSKYQKYYTDEYDHIIKVLQQMGYTHTLITACPIQFIKYVASILSDE